MKKNSKKKIVKVKKPGYKEQWKPVIKDNQVAILYSPGYGAGWSTWNKEEYRKTLLMHPELVEWTLETNHKKNKLQRIIGRLFGEDQYVCILGADQLKVEWVPSGSQIRINDHDGNESLEFYHSIEPDFIQV